MGQNILKTSTQYMIVIICRTALLILENIQDTIMMVNTRDLEILTSIVYDRIMLVKIAWLMFNTYKKRTIFSDSLVYFCGFFQVILITHIDVLIVYKIIILLTSLVVFRFRLHFVENTRKLYPHIEDSNRFKLLRLAIYIMITGLSFLTLP